MVKRVSLLVLLVGAVATLGFMVYAGDPASGSWWLFFVPFAGWALLPYALVGVATRWQPSSRGSQSVLCVAAVLLTCASVLLLYSAFVAQPDPQSGLILIFLPLWQGLGLLPFLGVSRVLARRGATASTEAGVKQTFS